MKTIHMTDHEWKRSLALVRCQALIERSPEWDELLAILEVDRPCRNVVPIASRRADVDEQWDTHQRMARLQRIGQDEAMLEAEATNRG